MTHDPYGAHPQMGDPNFEPPSYAAPVHPQAQVTVPTHAPIQAPQRPVPQGNPLAQYFRVPGLHVMLPTGGAYLPAGALETDAQGAVAVFPMRASDEFLLKNPDALMSGMAVERLLESCVPGIKTPSMISSPDLDVLLLAIRAATYGEKMEITVRCPNCGETNEFYCHLPSLLDTVKELPKEVPVRLSDELTAYVRPYNIKNANQIALMTFNETRRIQALNDRSEEERMHEMRVSMEKIANAEARITAECVYRVVTPLGEVTNPQHIAEFLSQTNSRYVKAVEEALARLNDTGMDKTMPVKCQEEKCGHEWTTNVEFDPASFFE